MRYCAMAISLPLDKVNAKSVAHIYKLLLLTGQAVEAGLYDVDSAKVKDKN